MGYPRTINNLIESFKKLPGIGEKTAERMALSVLELDSDIVKFFAENLLATKTKIRKCSICNNLSETEICEICSDKTRDTGVLCIVEEPKNLITFEKIGVFNGKYHVLGGLISPLDNITPEDINISNLLDRVKKENIKEIMIEEKDLSSDDIEMLQDMIVVAINDAMNKIDKETENKMGKYTQGMPGLF